MGWIGARRVCNRVGGVDCVVQGKKDSERDKNKKVDGEEEKKKKRQIRQKKGGGKKIKFLVFMVLGRIDPSPQPRGLQGPPFGPQVPPERL